MERGVVNLLSALLLAFVVLEVSRANALVDDTRPVFNFWGRLRIDCGVSIWSLWGPTNNNGYRFRTRSIVRRPQNGGKPCPPLKETDFDPWIKASIPHKASRIEERLISGRTTARNLYWRIKRNGDTIKPRDFLFILDMSGSIKEFEFDTAKENIAKLVGKMCVKIGPDERLDNRAAMITYSTDPVENFDFDDYLNLASLQSAIRDSPKVSQKTCTGKALDLGKTMFTEDKGARTDDITQKEVILITDGKSNCGPNAINSALGLRNSKTPPLLLFVFAIGNFTGETSRTEIESMASQPTSYHTFHLVHFPEFQEVVDFILQKPTGCAPIELGS